MASYAQNSIPDNLTRPLGNFFAASLVFHCALGALLYISAHYSPHEESWGGPGGGAGFGVALPHDGKPMSVGNGVMAAFGAKDKAQVDRIHQLALSLGGTCEGPPGQRSPQFYAAYFRDPDGNKLNAFVMG